VKTGSNVKPKGDFTYQEKIDWLRNMAGKWFAPIGTVKILEHRYNDFVWFWDDKDDANAPERHKEIVYGITDCFDNLYDIRTNGFRRIESFDPPPQVLSIETLTGARILLNWCENKC